MMLANSLTKCCVIYQQMNQKVNWKDGSVMEHSPSILEALNSITKTTKSQQKNYYEDLAHFVKAHSNLTKLTKCGGPHL